MGPLSSKTIRGATTMKTIANKGNPMIDRLNPINRLMYFLYINSIKEADGIKIIKRPLVVDDYKPLKFTFNEDNSINYAGGVVL